MALILYIETATTVCAVALSADGKKAGEKLSSESRAHAQLLTVFIDELLAEAGFSYQQLDAICVSKGPGSYTGLRIGVAAAKGLCYALEKPLIAINTLYSMAACMKEQYSQKSLLSGKNIVFCPMIDARRMEVYTAIYDYQLQEILPTKALIMDADSFIEYKEHKLIFFGDGSGKLKGIINPSLNAVFAEDFAFNAFGMLTAASERYHLHQFEDLAYFEPYYLKEFIGHKGG